MEIYRGNHGKIIERESEFWWFDQHEWWVFHGNIIGNIGITLRCMGNWEIPDPRSEVFGWVRWESCKTTWGDLTSPPQRWDKKIRSGHERWIPVLFVCGLLRSYMCNIVSLYSCSFCFKKHQFLVYVRGVILWNMVLLCLLISLWTANTGMVRMGEPSSADASVWWNCIRSVGGWAYPSEKYEFVSWDDEIPNIWKNKIHVPNQQPDQVN